MKVKRVFAMLLAVGMMATTGCSTRGNNSSSSMPSVPDVVSSIEDGMEDLRSDIEHGISDLEDDFRSGDESEDMMESENESDLESGLDTSAPTELEDLSDLESESAAAAMSTDLEQIGALSADKKGWGPGLNVDADNRPLGATDYQQKYGAHGAYFIAPKSNKIYLTFD
ncbi:MAG: hypothetical protein LBV27_07300, partial [Oscillospiraceae bacterium]|nr:hypothetical protein [Oscillospiraceae bacterium]